MSDNGYVVPDDIAEGLRELWKKKPLGSTKKVAYYLDNPLESDSYIVILSEIQDWRIDVQRCCGKTYITIYEPDLPANTEQS